MKTSSLNEKLAVLTLAFLSFAILILCIGPKGQVSAALGGSSHAPILIQGDNEFDAAHGVTGGSGTPSNPYIIENWIISASTAHGIKITNTTAYFIVRNCRVDNGGRKWEENRYYGVVLSYTQNGVIESTITDNNAIGICLSGASNNTLTNNITSNNNTGIALYGSYNNTLNGNTTNSNGSGIYLDSSSNNTLNGNTASGNTRGVYLFREIRALPPTNNNVLTNNIVSNNNYGMYLYNSDNNTLNGNTASGNNCGVYLSISYNNLIYNNYFNNDNNWSKYDSENSHWNIDPTPDVNIIGGPYLGGNYWSDYTGVDTDGDGLGDEDQNGGAPGLYGPGDEHPLSTLPQNNPPTAAFTYSPSSPTTDNTIQFTDQSTDNDGVIVSWYWNFGDGATSTIQNPTHKYSSAGTYPISLTVTDNGGASDTESKSITVTSVTPKVTTSLSISPSSFIIQSGSSTTLTATLKDNMANDPLANKTINWSKTAGSLSPTSGTTNSYGQVTVTYTAPTVTTYTSVTITASFVGDNQYQASTGLSQCNVYPSTPTTLTQHVPITIDGNSQFDSAHGVTSGSGIAGNPYIIENWTISAASAHGIYIQNTTAYFVVRNCLVENDRGTFYGIYLDNVINGRIENNACYNNCGIYLSSSNYITLTGNICGGNSNYGIGLTSSSNNTLDNNICPSNSSCGIRLGSSSNYNTLTNNNCSDSNCGIVLEFSSSNNILANNNCSNGGSNGIVLWSTSNYNTLTNNNCSNGSQIGIWIGESSHNTLTNNTCSNNSSVNNRERGIYLSSSSSNNILTGNTCENNVHGIWLWSSPNNTLTNNACSNNRQYGILLDSSSSNTITLNYLLNNTNNAYDNRTNSWDNNGRGNYWSDWQSPDANHDGIVDNARSITGGSNKDNYPLVISIRTATALAIAPSSFTLYPSENKTFIATLRDENNNALANRTINWSATAGTLSASISTTNSSGWTSVTYTAPQVTSQTSVIITTQFMGDSQYQASYNSSEGTVLPQSSTQPTSLSIFPPYFTLFPGYSGQVQSIVATLKDANNNPLPNRTVAWSATSGSVDPSSSTTDASGQVSVVYTAPTVTAGTSVTVTASFAGDNQYRSSSATSSGIPATQVSENISASTGGTVTVNVFEINVTVNVLVVSPNAIPENMTVTVQQIPPENAGAYVMLSHIFDIGPNETNFITPATLTLPYDENKLPAGVSEDNLAIYYLNDSNNWERVGGNVNKATKTVSVLINHLSKYAVMAELATTPQVEGGIPLIAVILAVLGVSAAAAASSAWIYLQRTRGEATSKLIEHGLHSMSLQEADIFREIRERKEFTIVDLMRETGASNIIVWRTVQKLMKKGLVKPTGKTIAPVTGRGKPSTVYKYVGD